VTTSGKTGRSRAPSDYHVRARARAGGPAEAHAGSELIRFDATWGGPDSGLPGPAELLASAFAACLLKNLARTGKLLRFRYQSAEVDVTAHRQDAPPKFARIRYEVRLVTDEPPQRVDLIHRNLRQFGTVYNTLAAGCDIDGRVVTVPPERAASLS
jgi:uncharacterized OsmC-like protein